MPLDLSQPEETQNNDTHAQTLELCESARQLLRESLYDDAMIAASRAVKLNLNCLAAYQLQADLSTICGNIPAGIAALTEIIRLDPECAEAYDKRGLSYSRIGQFERAILDCNKAISLDSLLPNPYQTRAYCLFKLGKDNESNADVKRSLLLSTTPEKTDERDNRDRLAQLLDRADSFLESGRSEDAIQAASAILLDEPDHIKARRLRATAYQHQGRFEEASTDLMEALRLQDEHHLTGRGYLVSIEDEEKEWVHALFPHSELGEIDAIDCADSLIQDTSFVNLVRTKVYEITGDEIELLDWVWSEAAKKKDGLCSTTGN